MPFDVVVVGSMNLDLVATAHRLPGPGETVLGSDFAQYAGGKGLNQAVAAARNDASTAMIAALGDDDAGRLLRSVADHEHIDTSRVSVIAGTPTGRALIVVDDQAENSIVVIPGANGRARFDELPARLTANGCVLAQLEVPLDTVTSAFAAARAAGWQTVLNPAPSPVEGLPSELLAFCDVIVPNEHEVELLGGVSLLLDHGVGAVVVTRGAAGVSVDEASDRSKLWTVDAFDVTPVDTTGAGDAFCGALAARLAAGDDLRRSVRYAAAAGGLATTVSGAVSSIPRSAAVERLLIDGPSVTHHG